MLKRTQKEHFPYFYDGWVSEHLIHDVHFTTELQSIDDEILFSGGDLNKAGQAEKTPVGVVLPWRTKQVG